VESRRGPLRGPEGPRAGGFHADWNRPSEALTRRASAFADAKDTLLVGAGFHADWNLPPQALRAGRRPSPTQRTPSWSAQADRWPEAFTPIEIGLLGRCAPGVGLRRRKRTPSRSAQAFTPI